MKEQNMMKALSLYIISNDYCDGKESINEVIKKVDDVIKEYDEEKDYKNKISNIVTRLSLISELLLIKRLENNRKDLLVITQAIMKEIEKITQIVEEEE